MYNTGIAGFLTAACSPNRLIDTYVTMDMASSPQVFGTNEIVSYKIRNTSTAGKSFVPGSFVASQLELSLNLASDKVSNLASLLRRDNQPIVNMLVQAGIQVDSEMVYVPKGKFHPEKDGITIGDDGYMQIKATDIPPILFTQFASGELIYPLTLKQALEHISNVTGLTISMNESDFPNLNVPLTETFQLITTYRETLMYIAEMLGAYVSMGRTGEVWLRKTFGDVVDIGCELDENYLFSVLKQESLATPFHYISIKADKNDLGVTQEVENVDNECIYTILDNPLTYGHPEDFLQGLVEPTRFTAFFPSKISFQGRPDLDTGDVVEYTYKDIKYLLPICVHTFEYNGGFKTSLESVGSDALLVSSVDSGLKSQITALKQNINILERELTYTKSQITRIDGDVTQLSELVQTVDALSSTIRNIEGDLDKLSEVTQTADEVTIKIRQELSNGVSKVVTETGVTVDAKGLSVDKSGSEMKTQITEDGMTVYKNQEPTLQANHEGVKATDLHATTYLIIGTNSRFEDYGSDRTGCFWIGG